MLVGFACCSPKLNTTCRIADFLCCSGNERNNLRCIVTFKANDMCARQDQLLTYLVGVIAFGSARPSMSVACLSGVADDGLA